MDVFLQEHGKTVFIAVCILLLVGVAYAIGPVISKAVQDVVGSYTTSVTFDRKDSYRRTVGRYTFGCVYN